MRKRNLAAATDADLAGAFDREACKGDECSVRLDQSWLRISGLEVLKWVKTARELNAILV